jgi:hypothetical protein
VIIGVVFAVPSFILGPAYYKTLLRQSVYMDPGGGEELTEAFSKDEAGHITDSAKIASNRNKKAMPSLVSPLPLSTQADLPLWKWIMVAMITSLAVFTAIAIAFLAATRVIWWIQNGFSSEQRLSQESFTEFDLEDLILENTKDMLDTTKGRSYEDVEPGKPEGFLESTTRDWTGVSRITPRGDG